MYLGVGVCYPGKTEGGECRMLSDVSPVYVCWVCKCCFFLMDDKPVIDLFGLAKRFAG